MDQINLQKFINDVRIAILSTQRDETKVIDIEDVDNYCFALYWFMLHQPFNNK